MRAVVPVIVLLAAGASAQPRRWESLGPPGGSVTAILVDPRATARVLAGTERAGVFRSESEGAAWTGTWPGLSAVRVHRIVEHPTSATTFFAATSNGLLRTINGATTWTQVPTRGATSIDAFAVNPAGHLFAATATFTSAAGGPQLLKSTDDGASFATLTLPGPPGGILSLAVGPTAGAGSLYACVALEAGDFKLFKSTDGGASWTDVTGDLAGPTSVYVDPVAPENVFVTNFLGVARSSNGGTDWTALAGGLPVDQPPSAFALDPTAPSNLVVAFPPTAAGDPPRVLRSADRGETWTSAAGRLPSDVVVALAVKPGAPSRIFAGSPAGISVSTNGGETWISANAGLSAVLVSTLGADGSTDGGLWVGTGSGGHRSRDRGATWTSLNLSGPVRELIVHPAAASTALALAGGTLMRTTNGGDAWTPLGNGVPDGGFQTLVLASSQPDTLYAGNCGAGVYRSTNGGADWSALGGSTIGRCVTAVAVDALDSQYVLAASNAGWLTDGLLVSRNGGGEWTAPASGLPTDAGISALAVQPGSPRRLFAAVERHGVYASDNGGASWASVGGLAAGSGPFAVDVSNGRLFASSDVGGVWVTENGGAAWTELTDDLADPAVTRLSVDPSGSWLYAATVATGVYSLRLSPRPDAGTPTDAGTPADGGAGPGSGLATGGCGCTTGVSGFSWVWLGLAALGARSWTCRRRRRSA